MTSFEILDIWRPAPADLAYYRVLANTGIIRYFVVDKPKPEKSSYRGRDALAFDTIPDGDWTIAHLVYNDEGKLVVSSLEIKRLRDVTEDWHPVKIDLQRLGASVLDPPIVDDLLYAGHPWAGTFRDPRGVDVPRALGMWEPWYHHPSFGLTSENHYRALIDGRGIAPRFLGHLTENGSRIIGCLVESPNARPAAIDDLTACRAVLRKLHGLGIAHGRVIRDNFLVLDDGTALLKEFFKSYKTSDQTILDQEMATVEKVLAQPLWGDHDSGGLSEDLSKQLQEIIERDGNFHPVVLWEAEHEGRITIAVEEHKALLGQLWNDLGQRWSDEDMENALRSREDNGGRWFPLTLRSPDEPRP